LAGARMGGGGTVKNVRSSGSAVNCWGIGNQGQGKPWGAFKCEETNPNGLGKPKEKKKITMGQAGEKGPRLGASRLNTLGGKFKFRGSNSPEGPSPSRRRGKGTASNSHPELGGKIQTPWSREKVWGRSNPRGQVQWQENSKRPGKLKKPHVKGWTCPKLEVQLNKKEDARLCERAGGFRLVWGEHPSGH